MKKIFLFFVLLSVITRGGAQNDFNFTETAQILKEAVSRLEEAKRKGSPEAQALAAYEIGRIYEAESLGLKAAEYFYLALKDLEGGTSETKNLEEKLFTGLRDAYRTTDMRDSVLHFNNLLLDSYGKDKKGSAAELKALEIAAETEEQNGNFPAAFAAYDKILKRVKDQAPERLIAFNNLACLYNRSGNFFEAIDYFTDAEKENEGQNVLNKNKLYSNMGIAYTNAGNTGKALEYFAKATAFAADDAQRAEAAHLTAAIYLSEKDWYNAQQFNNLATQLANQTGNQQLLSECYATAAEAHQGLYEYEDALKYYEQHLQLRDSLALEERLRRQSLLQQQFLLEKAEKEIKLLLVNEEINELTINRLELERNNLKLESDKYALEAAQQEASIALLQQEKAIREAELQNQELAAAQAEQQLRLTKQLLDAEQKDRRIAELKQREELQKLELDRQEALEKKQQQEIEMLNQQQAISALELEKQETFRQGAYIAGGLLTLILALMAGSYWFARRTNRRLAAQKIEIEQSHAETEAEKAKSDELLLNILPAATAAELKENGTATPRHYGQVTVLFTDFVNFTSFAESISAEELIEELNACFVAFDEIIVRHGLEKIKTIGDAYMCAGGIPTPNATNAADAVRAGLEMQDFIQNRCSSNKKIGRAYCEMRVGIHTGPVVAGVVGKNKFAYDIWGDTVNLASRMESSSEIGAVNISENTYQLINEKFSCKYRGEVEVKNKGEVRMYEVLGGI